MKRKDILATLATMLIFGIGTLWFFRQVYDTSREEQLAKSLIGRPWSEVERVMGKPSWKFDAKTFNDVERANIRQSWSPKEIPVASGQVYLYQPKMTLVLLYEKGGIVATVYVGKT